MKQLNITLTTIVTIVFLLLAFSVAAPWTPDRPDSADLRTQQIVAACQAQGFWDTGTVRITCEVHE